jgi:hypothetical protein
MANPFYIEPANAASPLESLLKGYDTGRKYQIENTRQTALAQLMTPGAAQGGTPDYAGVAKSLAASGDLVGATQIAGLNKALAGPESTDEIKEYNLSKQQGYKGSFTDWKTGLKIAGSTRVNTNVINKPESEYDKAVAKDYADVFTGLQKSGRNAPRTLGTLNAMEGYLNDPNFHSGFGGETALRVNQGLTALGIKDSKAASATEAFRALGNQTVIDAAGGSLGTAVSNGDRDFIAQTAPNLANTPEGNRELIGMRKKLAQREIDASKFAREYAAKNGGRLDAKFDDALAQWAEANPLFKGQAPRGAPSQGRAGQTGTGVKWRAE